MSVNLTPPNETPARRRNWSKTSLILGVLLVGALVAPDKPIDPWELLDLKKVMTVIFALAFLQTAASVVVDWIGSKASAVLIGFLAGLVSSTATTASVAKNSQNGHRKDLEAEAVILLSATLAMLCEAVVVLAISVNRPEPALYSMFAAPVIACGLLIWRYAHKIERVPDQFQQHEVAIIPLLKLAIFIVAILAVSKFMKGQLGNEGLMVLTFGVSLFEIHGSIIANVQLSNAQVIGHDLLSTLFMLSVVASFTSKMGLVLTMGSRALKWRFAGITGLLVTIQILSWLAIRHYLNHQ